MCIPLLYLGAIPFHSAKLIQPFNMGRPRIHNTEEEQLEAARRSSREYYRR
jgi:hypothetical protein